MFFVFAIVIILFIFFLFLCILGHFLNFIDDLFGITKNRKKEEMKLSENIGIITANCPYCGIELKKFPGRKTKCKNCGNDMYVRTRPYDNQQILIKEDEIQTIQDEWAKKNGTYSSIPVIDASKEMNEVIKYMKLHYTEYWNYDEILNVEEKDRLSIMQYVWENWNYRNVDKNLIKKYPQYDKDDIQYIAQKEMSRVYTYYHWEEHKKTFGKSGILIKVRPFYLRGSEVYFCDVKDEMNVYNADIDDDVSFTVAPQEFFKDDLECEYINFWENDKFIKMTPNEFKKFCKEKKYIYPFK